jgi:hypothetical protein
MLSLRTALLFISSVIYCLPSFIYLFCICNQLVFVTVELVSPSFYQLYHGAGTIDNLSPSWTQLDPGAGGSSISTYSGAGTEGDLWDPPNQSMVVKRAGGYAF